MTHTLPALPLLVLLAAAPATAAAAGQTKPDAAADLEKTGSFADFKIIADEPTQ